MFVSSNIFANACDDYLNSIEDRKNVYINKYSKSWNELLTLTKSGSNKIDRFDSTDIQNIMNIERNCNEDSNYLDDINTSAKKRKEARTQEQERTNSNVRKSRKF